MAHIKETIELLAAIFKDNGLSKIKAETFRLAKFDDDRAAVALWRLLFEVLYYLKYKKVDDVAIEAFGNFTKDELTVYVKTRMKRMGFRSDDFYTLPSSMASGSRELLLAFGWILCHSRLIEVFMSDCATPLESSNEGLLELSLTSADLVTAQGEVVAPPMGIPSMGHDWSVSDKVRYLLWFNGKLRMTLKNLYSMQQAREKLQKKITNFTRGGTNRALGSESDIEGLTPLEVSMLRNPELLRKNLRLLEKDNCRLENLLKWRNHEKNFWKWMESVLDSKIDSSEADDNEGAGLVQITPRSRQVTEAVGAKLQLANALLNYQELVDNVEAALTTKGSSVTSEELDNILSSIECEIAIHSANLLAMSGSRAFNDSTVGVGQRSGVAGGDAVDPLATSNATTTTASSSRTPSECQHFASPVGVARARPVAAERGQTETSASELESEAGLERELTNIDAELMKLQSLVSTLQADIEYKQEKPCEGYGDGQESALWSGDSSVLEDIEQMYRGIVSFTSGK